MSDFVIVDFEDFVEASELIAYLKGKYVLHSTSSQIPSMLCGAPLPYEDPFLYLSYTFHPRSSMHSSYDPIPSLIHSTVLF